jgi:hypothetical protein
LFADSPSVDPVQPELMLRPAQDVLKMDALNCVAIGPGLGESEAAKHALAAALSHQAPLVLDADALNLLAAHPNCKKRSPQGPLLRFSRHILRKQPGCLPSHARNPARPNRRRMRFVRAIQCQPWC